MASFDEYGDLAGTGFESKEPVAPEDEKFHSIYIAGQMRVNHINIEETIGKLQIRGVEYNLDKVYMIITHTKQVLCNATTKNQKETVNCFSFQEGEPPWIGTSGRECGRTSVERAANPECSNCRAQLIVAGIICNEHGKPVLGEDKKPKFGFIRGKGMKYSNVSEYLNEIGKLDLTPIFEPVTEESAQFERAVVNNKRFVIEITRGTAKSAHGDKMVFVLNKGAELPKKVVLDVLKIAKQTIKEFNNKFDWSKNRGVSSSKSASNEIDESMKIPDSGASTKTKPENESKNEAIDNDEEFDFSGVAF